MWIKICGTTTLADARLAIDLGADALGFIFAPSRRRVTPAQVAAITPLLPEGVERIGVFTSGEPEEIAAAALLAGLSGVQLHGEFPPGFYTRLHAAGEGRLTLIRTLHWTVHRSVDSAEQAAIDISEAGQLAGSLHTIADSSPEQRVLLDSRVDNAVGGTGVSFPWKAAASALDEARGSLHLIVAGGLRPDNVADAISALAPFGVDVASGVEQQPGKKDPKRLQTFIEKARAAFASLSAHKQTSS